MGNSLAVQWLRLCTSSVQIPSQQTKFSRVMGCGKKKKKRLVVGLRRQVWECEAQLPEASF